MGKATQLNLFFAGQNKRDLRAAGDHAVQLTATRLLILVIMGHYTRSDDEYSTAATTTIIHRIFWPGRQHGP